MKKICVSGASGFIGYRLSKALKSKGYHINAVSRVTSKSSLPPETNNFYIKELFNFDEWTKVTKDCDTFIHCAALNNDAKPKNKNDFYKINTHLTTFLAKNSQLFGIKRFIFLSSVKVNGTYTFNNFKFSQNDNPKPGSDLYALSKKEAEDQLFDIFYKNQLEIVIIRLPLVYGPRAKGNLEKIIKLIKLGLPLPFGSINNKISMIALDNLIDFITKCIENENAIGKILMPTDDEDLSTIKLVEEISSNLNQKVKIFPVPIFLLKLFGFLFGKLNQVNKLVNSAQIDCSETNNLMNWAPPHSVKDSLKKMMDK